MAIVLALYLPFFLWEMTRIANALGVIGKNLKKGGDEK